MQGDVNKLLCFQKFVGNVLPLHLEQTFPPIFEFFTEGEGDGIESRLPLKIFSALQVNQLKKVHLVYHFMKEFEQNFCVSLSNNLSILNNIITF